MGSVKYFISIDLYSGYWQYCIAEEDNPKTIFFMRYSLYKWVVMPKGLTNAPATFMHTINNLFSNILDFGMAVFHDDIPMFLCIVDKHFILLEKVQACLHHCTFYCKLKKCSFLHNSTTFLGFGVIPEGMHISKLKL